MKKLIAILLVVSLFLLAACNQKPESVNTPPALEGSEVIESSEELVSSDSEVIEDIPGTAPTVPQELIDLLVAPKGEIKFDQETFKQDGISIEYPIFTGLEDQAQESLLNEKVREYALTLIDKNVVDDSDLLMDIKADVKLVNEKLVSIVFSGEANFEQAAHPWSVFETINIKLDNMESFSVSEYVKLDEANMHFIIQNPKAGYDSELIEAAKTALFMSPEETLQYISEIDTPDALAYSYFTENIIGFSLPVSHVAGDHMEFEIPVK